MEIYEYLWTFYIRLNVIKSDNKYHWKLHKNLIKSWFDFYLLIKLKKYLERKIWAYCLKTKWNIRNHSKCDLSCHMHVERSILDSRVNIHSSNVEQFGLSVTRSNLNLYLTPKVPTRYKVTRMMYRMGMVPADKDVIEVYECTMLPSGHWSSHLDGYTILRYSSNYALYT